MSLKSMKKADRKFEEKKILKTVLNLEVHIVNLKGVLKM